MFVLPLSRSAHSAAHRVAYAPQYERASVPAVRSFDESLARIFGGASATSRSPALDVSETDSAYTLALEMPGVTREQLKVSVLGRRVEIETVDTAQSATPDATPPQAGNTPRVLYRERSAAKFARTVSLPAEVDQAGAEARFENGVLTLTLAKKVPTAATRIAIS